MTDFLDLNESSLYMFRIKSMNIYGESPWSMEIPVQTIETIVTSDGQQNSTIKTFLHPISFVDLPQLHVISYNSKDKLLHFDYLPDDERLRRIGNEQLCMHIRQSADGNLYQSMNRCLPIENNRVHWLMKKDFPFLKLAICSKKNRDICGQEIEMKDGLFPFNFLFRRR